MAASRFSADQEPPISTPALTRDQLALAVTALKSLPPGKASDPAYRHHLIYRVFAKSMSERKARTLARAADRRLRALADLLDAPQLAPWVRKTDDGWTVLPAVLEGAAQLPLGSDNVNSFRLPELVAGLKRDPLSRPPRDSMDDGGR